MIPSNQIFFNSSAAPIIPSPLILSWYNSLAVKPSDALLDDLNTLVDGMNTDGDWTEMDYFSLMAGLETDEQRKLPLNFLTPQTWDAGISGSSNGTLTNGASIINTNFNPTIHAVKFTLNNAFIYVGGRTINSTLLNSSLFGNSDFVGNATILSIETQTTNVKNNSGLLNSINPSPNRAKSLIDSPKTFTIALKRTTSSNINQYVNENSYSSSLNSTIIVDYNYYLHGFNEGTPANGRANCYIRSNIIGSSLIDYTRITNRLHTFYTSRGLSIANY